MKRNELKIRTQQAINAIRIFKGKDYGWSEMEKMLYEILIELDDSDWQTGTPTEGGLFIVCLKDKTYDIYEFGKEYEAWNIGFRDVVAWQRIEPYKEESNG